jgi:hypothetical protein
VETLEFSPLERQIYDQVYHNAKSTFKTLDAKGAVGKNWHSIFALLMRFDSRHLLLLPLTPFSDCAELFYILL